MASKLITNQPSFKRQLSPTAKRSSTPLSLLAAQIYSEFMQNFRVPEFLIGVAVIPTILFMMFGLPNAGESLPGGTTIGSLMMASFAAYGIVSLCIFTFGVDIAQERGRGWLRLMRASPLPAWVYFAGKLVMAILFALVIMALLFLVAVLFGGVRLAGLEWLQLSLSLLLGGLSFSSMGFALAYWTKPRAASAIGNLVFLPLAFVSGFFFPLNQLPDFLQRLAPYLPTYHYGQLVWASAGKADDVALYVGQPIGASWVSMAWLLGSFLVFGVLAWWGYKRDQVEQFG
ncbi:MAG: ABC transporter permease [Trueperaceae bacterium]|nr:ABC transporter permease [Trueperaceae bacterium]